MSKSRSTYTIDLPVFNGPLDLLLHLIEREELDVTAISLAKVTGQYLAQIEQLKQNRIENLIDFLVIGARLAVIKSRALLPRTLTFAGDDEEEEEDPAAALVRQLRQYKRFKQAAAWLGDRVERGLRTYLRLAPPPKVEKRLDMEGVTVQTLISAVLNVLERVENAEDSVNIVEPRRITIDQQISRLRFRLRGQIPFTFDDLLSRKATRLEVAVTLLAVLELIKRKEAVAFQSELFGPIQIQAAPPDKSTATNGQVPNS